MLAAACPDPESAEEWRTRASPQEVEPKSVEGVCHESAGASEFLEPKLEAMRFPSAAAPAAGRAAAQASQASKLAVLWQAAERCPSPNPAGAARAPLGEASLARGPAPEQVATRSPTAPSKAQTLPEPLYPVPRQVRGPRAQLAAAPRTPCTIRPRRRQGQAESGSGRGLPASRAEGTRGGRRSRGCCRRSSGPPP